jgi:quinol monooxygenase YgiN
VTLGHEVKDGAFLRREIESPGLRKLAAAVRRARQPKVLQDLTQSVWGELTLAGGRMAKYFHQAIMDFRTGPPQIQGGEWTTQGGDMTRLAKRAMVAVAGLLVIPALPDINVQSTSRPDAPAWVQRGLPNEGHAALEPLIGTGRVKKSVFGTMGRSPDLPPIVSDDITTTREWVADGRYIQDTTTGTVQGQPYWRRGWLGYSNMDRRYEWVTIDSLNTTMMIYLGKPGSGRRLPIDVTGGFTDQGVVNEQTVGKAIAMRTVIRIENNDRHVYELYFTPPQGKEQLADRSVYTRVGSPERRESAQSDGTRPTRHGIALPSLPDPEPGETGPYCLIAKHRARPGLADAYEKRMLADLERTRAETGALQFYIHRDRFDRNLFVIYEAWRDVRALREHFEKPYVLQFVADSAQYIEGNMEVQWLVMVGDPVAEKKVSGLLDPIDLRAPALK